MANVATAAEDFVSAGGEIRFRMQQRLDRNKNVYLFGSLRLFNMVVFAHPDRSTPGAWTVSIKPYTGNDHEG